MSTVRSTIPYFEKLVRSHIVMPLDPLFEAFCVILGLVAASVGNLLPVFIYFWHRVDPTQGVVSAAQASDRELK